MSGHGSSIDRLRHMSLEDRRGRKWHWVTHIQIKRLIQGKLKPLTDSFRTAAEKPSSGFCAQGFKYKKSYISTRPGSYSVCLSTCMITNMSDNYLYRLSKLPLFSFLERLVTRREISFLGAEVQRCSSVCVFKVKCTLGCSCVL